MTKKIAKVDSHHTLLAVISSDVALNKNDNYYLQLILKECKCTDKKVIRNIHDNLSFFFLLIILIKSRFFLINT